MFNRRGLITGLISLVAAPAIVRIDSLMKVKAIEPVFHIIAWDAGILSGDYSAIMKSYWDEVQQKFAVEQINAIDFYK